MLRPRRCLPTFLCLLLALACARTGDSEAPETASPRPPPVENPPPSRENMVRVRAGTFFFGLTEAQFQFFLGHTVMSFPGMIEQMRKRVAIPPRERFEKEFWIHRFEVTNLEFNQFLKATSYRPTSRHDFLRHWEDGRMPDWAGDFPVTWVSGSDAAAYCGWLGGEIPSETQWEKAARGARDARAFPWGEEPPDSSRANNGSGKIEPVGDRPGDLSPFQVYDLGGNVGELTRGGVEGQPDELIVRGGSFLESIRYALVGVRLRSAEPEGRFEDVGFRCVVD